jgi:cell wall-associated NlpC family hydrolase
LSNGQNHYVSTSLKRISVLAVAMVAGSFLIAPSPGSADPDSTRQSTDKPTLTEIKSRVDDLNHQAEILSERMNLLKVEMKAADVRLSSLQSDLRRQQATVDALRSQVVGKALSDFQNGGGISSSTSFLVADDPKKFLDDLANSAVAQGQQADMLTELSQLEQQLSVQKQQAQVEVDAIADDKAELGDRQAELDDKTAKAQAILDDLEAEQLERLMAMQTDGASSASRSTPRFTSNDVPASERAAVAVQTALAQVGDPYVYGAAGPDAFDCSGLTMYAWAAAGVSIPHASSAQPGAGTPVSFSQLMPGDLIFYYSPISHVGMYIGGGRIVHAPHPGLNVEVVPMNMMPMTMAVRIG